MGVAGYMTPVWDYTQSQQWHYPRDLLITMDERQPSHTLLLGLNWSFVIGSQGPGMNCLGRRLNVISKYVDLNKVTPDTNISACKIGLMLHSQHSVEECCFSERFYFMQIALFFSCLLCPINWIVIKIQLCLVWHKGQCVFYCLSGKPCCFLPCFYPILFSIL